MPEIGVFKYSATAGEGTPEELLTSSIDKVVEGLSDYPDAKFGINIPVSEEFIPAAIPDNPHGN